ncbi:hypothetical protein PHSY_006125 [Pseudozyma hubeiensis SY62]|uniref:Uncharacterized protein n=1 Tax=Pseudozyma hubeiensis (strain SY62) TaxID=1305764 RepID=R9PAX6_PSEHS|nr:hypothetical protein PHSY_006125 [Pseudozyma hubeiensis SY62]GAC98531.1 hypothetical protein PHSY_006125 [Pseudozyma hubeiensis SY62]
MAMLERSTDELRHTDALFVLVSSSDTLSYRVFLSVHQDSGTSLRRTREACINAPVHNVPTDVRRHGTDLPRSSCRV